MSGDACRWRALVVMGVSGVGKTTLATALANVLHYRFIEGDALHPDANVAKMAAGIALDDADRAPWLARVAAALDGAARADGGVATCSALRRVYRDTLRERVSLPLVFVHPTLDAVALRARMSARRGHYMPVGLLDSQLATLEPPGGDEDALVLDASLPLATLVEAVLADLRRRP